MDWFNQLVANPVETTYGHWTSREIGGSLEQRHSLFATDWGAGHSRRYYNDAAKRAEEAIRVTKEQQRHFNDPNVPPHFQIRSQVDQEHKDRWNESYLNDIKELERRKDYWERRAQDLRIGDIHHSEEPL